MAQSAGRRPLKIDDLYTLLEVGNPEVSPDGQWVAYTVTGIDKEADKKETRIWMVSWDGSQHVRLTSGPESETSPRWSPDGKYISFLSSRPGKAKGSQVWVLDRRGGEAVQLTDVKGRLIDYSWSPDAKKLLLVLREPEDDDVDPAKPAGAPPKPPKPIVLDRYHFKQDIQGYLTASSRSRIHIFDIQTKKLDALTNDQGFEENAPVWSPDGSMIAFVSNHDTDPDRTHNTDVFVTDARPGSTPRKLTTYPGPDGVRLAWSPDHKWIAYLQGSEPKYNAYNLHRLAIVPASGGQPRVLTQTLDRGVSFPMFASDGSSITVLVADDRSEYPAKVSLSNGSIERLVGGAITASSQSQAAGHAAVIASNDAAPPEVFALEGSSFRKLTSHNDALLSELQLASAGDISFKSKDGSDVHGLLTTPLGYLAGKKYPLLLRIHGGPNGQDEHAFMFERQLFAANGYAVLNVNYRGSAGRGQKFSESIFGDWGSKEVADLLAGVDHVVAMGVADPDRLGIGGWSYGGILTNYTIASDSRFKVALSGAGSSNQISMYGIDQYVTQYEEEIGSPWRDPQPWVRISYPFFKADRIHTPTLFMGGERDFNVPIAGSEQMYQALRTLGVPTELVIYPGQFHIFTRPSFIHDRYQRYLAWYDKYLKGPAVTSTAAVTSR
jgi:dipeptidyl aminopeptidase/acylaminoacyl peptidase